MLIDTNVRNLRVNIFDHDLPAPIMFAPIGINANYHADGELIPARVAGELGLPYCLSTAASQTIEDVAKANGNGPRFYQLYVGPHRWLSSRLDADDNLHRWVTTTLSQSACLSEPTRAALMY